MILKKIEICVITYITCPQNFCSRATNASTNADAPDQEPLHFQMALQNSNTEED